MGKSQIQTCFEKKEKDKVKHRAQYHLCTLNISTHRYIHKNWKNVNTCQTDQKDAC